MLWRDCNEVFFHYSKISNFWRWSRFWCDLFMYFKIFLHLYFCKCICNLLKKLFLPDGKANWLTITLLSYWTCNEALTLFLTFMIFSLNNPRWEKKIKLKTFSFLLVRAIIYIFWQKKYYLHAFSILVSNSIY